MGFAKVFDFTPCLYLGVNVKLLSRGTATMIALLIGANSYISLKEP